MQNDAQEMESHHMKVQALFLPSSGKHSNKEYYETSSLTSLFLSSTKLANFSIVLTQRSLCGNQFLIPFHLSIFFLCWR